MNLSPRAVHLCSTLSVIGVMLIIGNYAFDRFRESTDTKSRIGVRVYDLRDLIARSRRNCFEVSWVDQSEPDADAENSLVLLIEDTVDSDN